MIPLNYIHNKKWIHRDIKPGNIMIKQEPNQENFTIKLIDFGTCNQQISSARTHTGTDGYAPPEWDKGVS